MITHAGTGDYGRKHYFILTLPLWWIGLKYRFFCWKHGTK